MSDGGSSLLNVPIDDIEPNPKSLRAVDTETEQFEQLVDSITRRGIINPINLTPAFGADGRTPRVRPNGAQVFYLVDGLHRWTAAREAGLKTIPAQVSTRTQIDTLYAQVVANAKRIETKAHDYSKHLVRILEMDPTKTHSELAAELSMSPQWLTDRLGLAGLTDDIGAMVDAGKITVANAVALAKLRSKQDQLALLQAAIEEPTLVFKQMVASRVKELNDAKRAARDPNAKPTFTPMPRVRDLGELRAEFVSPSVLPDLIRRAGISDPVQAAKFTLAWLLKMDDESIQEQKVKWEARQAAQADAKIKAKAERDAKRAAESAALAAKVTA